MNLKKQKLLINVTRKNIRLDERIYG